MTDSRETAERPCSVKARQGFSVYYRNRYLYSQYDAEKPVTRLIDSLTILPETLILACSPVLGTGLQHLLDRLPQNCFVLAVEFDPLLYDFFMKSEVAQTVLKNPHFSMVLLDRPERMARLLSRSPSSELLSQNKDDVVNGSAIPPQGSFRRCLPIEMSGGTAFFQNDYRLAVKFADDAIAVFWKNHITLTKLGRLYARNMLSNIKLITKACPLKAHSISKPILALGAGPSLDELLPQLPSSRNDFFIIAADAALPALAQYEIRPDAVIGVESQLAIEKSYIGFEGSGIPLIADLTSRPRVLSIMGGPVSLFMTEYCNEPFMQRFKKLCTDNRIPVFPPLGSVGLYALETALHLRAEGTPVFFSGLDFAWGKGSTHCKGAPAHTNALLSATRLNPPGNPAAAFSAGTSTFTGKDGAFSFTTPNLANYGKILSERYRHTSLLFDAGSTGMHTGIQAISIENMLLNAKKHIINACSAENDDISQWLAESAVRSPVSKDASFRNEGASEKAALPEKSPETFLADEQDSIREIVTLTDSRDEADGSSCKRLSTLLAEHSYLYLHFPDAARGPSLTRDFLIRVKVECGHLLAHTFHAR